MLTTTRDSLEILAKLLLRCWLFGFVLLFITLASMLLMGDTIQRMHGSMFGLSSHEIDLFLYGFLGFLKLQVLTFFFIPWLSIRWLLWKK